MKLHFFIIYCILQSCHGANDSEVLTPDTNFIEKAVLYMAGGSDAEAGQFPYQCSIQDNVQHYCGCAVINADYVLTASHCLVITTPDGRVIFIKPEQIKIMVGSIDWKTGGTFYKAELLITHEDFNKPTRLANDIGIVKVKGPIQFNEFVKPIALRQKEVSDGDEVTLTGWGRLQTEGYVSKKMQFLTLDILGMDKCNSSAVSHNITKLLQEGNICTNGAVGSGACQGDSGGCLAYNKTLVGIVSYGIPCGEGSPDVYSSVWYYYDWIMNHISN